MVSFTSMTGKSGQTLDTRLLIFAVVDSAKIKAAGGTMEELWLVVTWSFGCLLAGKWPSCDWKGQPWPANSRRAQRAGEPLCGNHVFAVMQVSADLDYLCNYLGLEHFNSRRRPCFKCHADRAAVPWSDLRPSAAWRQTLVTAEEWRHRPRPHSLFADLGLTVTHVNVDAMHCLDLGVAQHVCGSTLHLLMFEGVLDGSIEARAQSIWEALQVAYASLGTPTGERLPLSVYEGMWEGTRTRTPSRYPQLGAKAAIARHCVAAIRETLSPIRGRLEETPMAEEWRAVWALVSSLSEFYELLQAFDLCVPEDGAQALAASLQQAGVWQQWLSVRFMERGRQLFYMTVNNHYMQHIALDVSQQRLNPGRCWCYADEDYMGKIGRMASNSTRARGPLKVPRALLMRWRCVVSLRWPRTGRAVR